MTRGLFRKKKSQGLSWPLGLYEKNHGFGWKKSSKNPISGFNGVKNQILKKYVTKTKSRYESTPKVCFFSNFSAKEHQKKHDWNPNLGEPNNSLSFTASNGVSAGGSSVFWAESLELGINCWWRGWVGFDWIVCIQKPQLFKDNDWECCNYWKFYLYIFQYGFKR